MDIYFYNTLTRQKEKFYTIKPDEVTLYTCGPTVYDYAHIGNYRAYIFEDILKRTLILFGYNVKHVMNITDIDDKTIKGAAALNLTLSEFTLKYTEAFFEDLKTLNILKADAYPKATDYINDMADIIKKLMEKGYAYDYDGSIYFKISAFENYGRLARVEKDKLKKGARYDADEYGKEDVFDFVLWKKTKEGEPSWKTSVGEGRPGWHLECTAMSIKNLGETFDIHCGGVDNIFPHHENEIAQSEAYTGKKFVNFWMHCEHLIVNGEKMSKSKGNFYTLRDLINKKINPEAVRYLLMSTHYKAKLNFTFEGLEAADTALSRIKDFYFRIKEALSQDEPPAAENEITGKCASALNDFKKHLSDDLNISPALAVVFDFMNYMNKALNEKKYSKEDLKSALSVFEKINSVLGINIEAQQIPEEVLKLAGLRFKARLDKDWKKSDELRDEILKLGYTVRDKRDGWRVVKN